MVMVMVLVKIHIINFKTKNKIMKKIKLRALDKFVKDLAQRVEKIENNVFVAPNPQVPESLIPTQSPQQMEFNIGDCVEIVGNHSGHSIPIGDCFLINHLDLGGIGAPFTTYKGYHIYLNDLVKIDNPKRDFKQFDLCEVLESGTYGDLKVGEKAFVVGIEVNKKIWLQRIGEKTSQKFCDSYTPHQLKFIKNLLD
jgi:hypothetical protein